MAFDAGRDARRWRIALVASAAALLVGLVGALVEAGGAGRPPIREAVACDGTVDRCLTCHAELVHPQPALDEGHPPDRFGCAACHGGTSRALEAVAAHARPGSDQVDPLQRGPFVQGSCLRCHVPGDAPGMERLVRGARLYSELGCAMCHPLSNEGRGGWDDGPDLRTQKRTPLETLRTSLFEPTADFAGSTMPSFRARLEDEASDFEDLAVYLLGLQLSRPPGCRARDAASGLLGRTCASCHAGERGRAGGRFEHRCLDLKERRGELACGRCHDAIPASSRECPVIAEQKKGCGVCHLGTR